MTKGCLSQSIAGLTTEWLLEMVQVLKGDGGGDKWGGQGVEGCGEVSLA